MNRYGSQIPLDKLRIQKDPFDGPVRASILSVARRATILPIS